MKKKHIQDIHNTQERISVIIPVYNTEKYVERSVRSVMNQTYNNLSIICVNDGSTDGSLAILEKLAEEDERIIIITQDNIGLGGARNTGLKYVTSEWITFIDSDDELNKYAYEIASQAINTGADLIHFGTEIVLEEGVNAIKSDEDYYQIKYDGLVEISNEIILNSDVSAWNKLFRKSIIDKYKIHFEHIYYEDFSFTIQYLSIANSVYYFKEKLYRYTRRKGSIMSETFAKTPRAIDHLFSYSYAYDFMDKNSILSKFATCMTELFVNCFWFSITNCTQEKKTDVEDLALKIWTKSPLLKNNITRTINFAPKNPLHCKTSLHKKNKVSKCLEGIFSIKNENINQEINKVVRLFGFIIYKKRK